MATSYLGRGSFLANAAITAFYGVVISNNRGVGLSTTGAIDGFAVVDAASGDYVTVAFLTNNGTLPKEAMGHNLVVLKPGSDGAAFSAAAMTAKATDYVPESLKDQVVAHTALLGPRKSDEVILKDLKAGEYPYLCSFPAHYAVGMKGVLIVK